MRLLDLENAVAKQLGELPYPAYLCAMCVIAGEIRRAYFEFLSANGRALSAQTLNAVRAALRSPGSRDGGSGGGLVGPWEQLCDDPGEDGPAGWIAAVTMFTALAGELTGGDAPRSALAFVTATAAGLPEAEPAGSAAGPRLVEIDLGEEAGEDSAKVQMLRRFGHVAELAARRAEQGLPCDPDEIRSAAYG